VQFSHVPAEAADSVEARHYMNLCVSGMEMFHVEQWVRAHRSARAASQILPRKSNSWHSERCAKCSTWNISLRRPLR